MSGVGGLAAWKWLFIIEALPTLLIAVLVLTTLDNDIGSAKWLSSEDRASLQALVDAETVQKTHLSLREMFVNRSVQVMSLFFFCDIFAIYGLGFRMPTLISNMGVHSDLKVGLMSALPSACAVASMVVFSRNSDRTGERRWHLAVLYGLGALGMALSVAWEHEPVLGIVALCIANMGILAIPALFWNLPTAILGGAAAAAGIALINSFANLAGFLGPYIVGYEKQVSGSTEASVWLMTAVLVIGGMLTLTVPARLVNKARDC
jgi:Na+/melibiose symporter-like transporter